MRVTSWQCHKGYRIGFEWVSAPKSSSIVFWTLIREIFLPNYGNIEKMLLLDGGKTCFVLDVEELLFNEITLSEDRDESHFMLCDHVLHMKTETRSCEKPHFLSFDDIYSAHSTDGNGWWCVWCTLFRDMWMTRMWLKFQNTIGLSLSPCFLGQGLSAVRIRCSIYHLECLY